jgi:hypothetical protein
MSQRVRSITVEEMWRCQESEAKLSSDSPSDKIQSVAHEQWGKRRGGLLNGWFARGGWRVDSIYVWGAVAGLFVALVLIAVAEALRSGRLH